MAGARVETTGIPDEKVVAALFNASRPFGMGFYEYRARTMDEAEAKEVINDNKSSPFGQRGDIRNFYIDYVEGRCVKCQFLHEGERTYVETERRDRDYGDGATKAVIDALREELATPADVEKDKGRDKAEEEEAKPAEEPKVGVPPDVAEEDGTDDETTEDDPKETPEPPAVEEKPKAKSQKGKDVMQFFRKANA